MHVRRGVEPISDFAEAIREEKLPNNWRHYIKTGFYYQQLKRYFDTFDAGQIRIYLYEQFTANPEAIFRDICQYLEIDDSFLPDMSIKYHLSATFPKNKVLHDFLQGDNPIKAILKPLIPDRIRHQIKNHIEKKNVYKPQVSRKLRKELIRVYRDDILKLQDLIQIDLSQWLE
jgi:hypothetical protein